MTLHTRVMITSPGVRAADAFLRMRQLIGAGEQYDARTSPHGLHMDLGQGLPALLWVDHRDGDLIPAETCDEYCDAFCDTTDAERYCLRLHDPAGYVLVHFDTGYGYTAVNGAGCRDLHAWLVREFGAWLDDRGATWRWYDESGDGWLPSSTPWGTGYEWHAGDADRGALTAADHERSERNRRDNLLRRSA
ncbi:hypothetical protein INN71_02660 [Nocardioides sp. ChNu-153]|uniref:hypothetical protein n=1 Tax=unclassified Nocardioides TaxID=2615069 RepID=UPI0024058019|nr:MULTISPECIES: hypothetical protein [unclassified Nocardioides]MDF9718069.1 hypothetical protein [Nocardioides sp. ChNu-99]MDN7120287.1 hypothetical protein [Nocardioides sp. ChNu-153]